MSNELTRKDRLCENVVKMQERFGKEVFNILPDSYILPDEFADFYSHFHSLRSKEQTNMWIIKPQNSSQGKGIYIVSDNFNHNNAFSCSTINAWTRIESHFRLYDMCVSPLLALLKLSVLLFWVIYQTSDDVSNSFD